MSESREGGSTAASWVDTGEISRIGLGLKQTLEDPYATTAGSLEVGSTISGRDLQ